MSFMNAIQSMLPRPENRSGDEIARDVEDELAFHLEMRTRAIESEEGVDRATAGELARTRFGNVDRIRNECQRIALKERNMLQRVNLALMIVVMLVVVGVGAQVYITQRYNTLALQAITSDLAKMKFDAAAAGHAENSRSSAGGGIVFLKGGVARNGIYSLPPEGTLTIDRAINAAGGLQGDAAGARVQIKRRDGDGWRSFNYKLQDAGVGDFVLQNDDEITVTLAIDPRQFRAETALPVGSWSQIDEQARPMPGGATIESMASDDVRNTVGVPIGILTLPGDEEMYRLAFDVGSSPTNLRVQRMSNRGNLSNGRWELRSNVLTVNLAPALPEQDEPLRFAYKAAAGAPSVSDTRAKAVGDFVVRLFALADPSDPNLDQTIREFLDVEEKGLDQKYAGDPATAGMIKELIVARRKIFDADAGFRAAASAAQREKAVNDFLTELLAGDAPREGVSAAQLLDAASNRIDQLAGGDQALEQTLRARIAQARSMLAAKADTGDVAAPPAAAASSATANLVHLAGDVVRPGEYNMPAVGVLTLDRILTAAGGLKDGGDAEVAVDGLDDQGKPVRRISIPQWSSHDAADGRYVLKAGDRVTVKALPPGTASSGAMSDAELQKFIPRLMTASIPNSAASTLPTLAELNRAAAAIDIAYANDPTLLAKLRGMVETVRARLEPAPANGPTTAPEVQQDH